MITSTQNDKVKFWKKLKQKKYRDQASLYLLEGDHLVEEALKVLDPQEIEAVLLVEDKATLAQGVDPAKRQLIGPAVAEALSSTENSQGSFAVVRQSNSDSKPHINQPFLFIDGIQNPGNLGALIRTAAAAGFQGVVLGKGTVDLYNMKVLRGAQGTHFKLEIYEGDLKEWVHYFQDRHLSVVASGWGPESQAYSTIQPTDQAFGLMVGNEGAGSQADLLDLADVTVHIPLAKEVESLNVAVAAGILMFHLYRLD